MIRYALTDAVCLIRSMYFLIFSVVFSAAFYVMFTAVADQGNGDPGYSTAYMVAMAVSGSFFGALTGAGIRLGIERGDGWTRQILLTPLTPARYLAAKSLTAWLAALPAILVVFGLGTALNDVSLPIGRWIAVAGICWTGSLVFVTMGILIGLLSSGDAVQFVALGVFFPLAMLGGLWFPTDTYPAALRSFDAVLPTTAIRELGTSLALHTSGGVARWVVILAAWALLTAAGAVGLASRVTRTTR